MTAIEKLEALAQRLTAADEGKLFGGSVSESEILPGAAVKTPNVTLVVKAVTEVAIEHENRIVEHENRIKDLERGGMSAGPG